MDLQKLRERTRIEHEATEALLPLMSETLTRAAYGAELRKLGSVIRGWELWARERAPERFRPLIEVRQRSVLLARDLAFLGLGAVREPVASSLFEAIVADGSADGSDEAVQEARFGGVLYVVEGSTLGGQYIARHVEEVLGLSDGEGYAYFRGYGEQTGVRWREVRAALGDLAEDLLDEAVEGARRTFGLFAAALSETERPEPVEGRPGD